MIKKFSFTDHISFRKLIFFRLVLKESSFSTNLTEIVIFGVKLTKNYEEQF